jgi:uncharacterized membrane protein YjfL (UPF0719 family)
MEEWIVNHARPIVDSVLYSVLGTVVLLVCFWGLEKVLPFSIKKEIEHDQNVGLGVVLAAFILGISLIISSSIRG